MRSAHILLLAAALAAPLFVACEDEHGSEAPKVTALDPSSHEPYFPIRSGTHGGVECDVCHGAFDTFRQFDCLGCHEHERGRTDGIHGSLAGYFYDSPSCYACHPRGEAEGGGVDHHVLFPIQDGTAHFGVSCGGCHPDPANRAIVACAECHDHDPAATAPLHGSVGGFGHRSDLCLRCHGEGQVDRVADHGFLVTGGTPHFLAECLGCHPGTRADRPWAAEFATADCLGCHPQPETDPGHAGIDGYSYRNEACLLCHPTGVRGDVDHTPFFPIAQGQSHEAIECRTCHADLADRRNLDCITCHTHDAPATDAQHPLVGGYLRESPLCVRCHADSQVDPVAEHGFPIRADEPHFLSECLGCHPGDRADKPWGAEFGAAACATSCHERVPTEADHAGIAGFAYDDPSCLICHPTGSSTDAVDHVPIFPIAPGEAHGALLCAECHANPSDRHDVDCVTCHGDADGEHGAVGGYLRESRSCLRCHADSQVDAVSAHLPFRIQSGSDHHRKRCLECHPGTRADKIFAAADFGAYDCFTCHGRSHMDDKHRGRAAYDGTNASCLQSGCHPDGSKHDD